jgi:Reverse transcriptase (RNA-dependent DNA polymerase)
LWTFDLLFYLLLTTSLRLSFQQVTCLTLLDLSAAFDTIDHSIVLERLTAWFGSLSWMKSHLLNRSFYVNVENIKSSLLQLLCSVPQGSVLRPLLFILYTTPLSTVLSYLIHMQIIICMQMILNFSYHSLLLTFHTISLFLNLPYLHCEA